MKDIDTIDTALKLKEVWPLLIENGPVGVCRVVWPWRNLLSKAFEGCWFETMSSDKLVNVRYELKNGQTKKYFRNRLGDSVVSSRLVNDYSCLVFFSELVLQERHKLNGVVKEPGEYVQGPELQEVMKCL